MSLYASTRDTNDRFGSGLGGAIALHIALFAALIGWAFVQRFRHPAFGESSSAVGSIQASLVSALPLPPRAEPVEKSVLAADDVSKAPAPQPKDTTAPPPRPDDVLLKAKTAEKTAPTPTTANKHPQPTPETPKAASGEQATQIPQSIVQTVNGSAAITVQNRALGQRYAWYIRLIGNKVQQFYNQEYPDPRASLGKSVVVQFYVDPSGAPTDIQIQTASGSPTLDSAGKRAVQEVDTFGPNPAGQPMAIAVKFEYDHR